MAEQSAGAEGGASAPKSFEESFNAAVADATGAGDGDGGEEGGAEGAEETTDEGEGAQGEDTTTDDSEDSSATAPDASEEVETDEASSGSGEDESAAPPVVEDETPKLRSLRGKIDEAKTPEERGKAIQKYMDAALQPKFQAVAAQKKFIEAFRKDPVKAARQVIAEAAKKGLVTDGDGEAPQGGDAELKETLKAAGFTDQQTDVVAALLKPIQQQQSETALRNLASEVDNDLQSFAKDFPDYAELEPKMAKLMDVLLPAPRVNRRQYLENLRTLALGSKAVGTGVKKALKGMVSNAKGAAPKTRSVPDSTVQPGRKGQPLSFEESASLALEGKRVGRGISR